LSGVEEQPWWLFSHGQTHLRRSLAQPLFNPAVCLFEKAGKLAADRQFDDFALPLSTIFAEISNSS
jgi:hypothetical protein